MSWTTLKPPAARHSWTQPLIKIGRNQSSHYLTINAAAMKAYALMEDMAIAVQAGEGPNFGKLRLEPAPDGAFHLRRARGGSGHLALGPIGEAGPKRGAEPVAVERDGRALVLQLPAWVRPPREVPEECKQFPAATAKWRGR